MTKKTSIVAIVLIVVIAVGGFLLYFMYGKQADTNDQLPADPKQEVERLTQTSDKKELQEAQTKLSQFADREQDVEKKITYWTGAMDAAATAGDYKAALEFAQKVEEHEQSALSAGRVAGYAEMNGNYETAAQYFGIAAERSSGRVQQDYKAMQMNAEAMLE